MTVAAAGRQMGRLFLKCTPKPRCPPVPGMTASLRWVLATELTLGGPQEGSDPSIQLLELELA